MKEIIVTFFATSTEKGLELVEMLTQIFRSECPAGFNVTMNTVIDGDQGDMMIAGLRDDIIIFDGSFEDDIGVNYKAAQMWPSCMEHFLVVSRTRLPFNFEAYHEGGTPETAANVFELDNHKLADWIIEKITLLKEVLPRPVDERICIEKNSFTSNLTRIQKISEKIILRSSNKRDKYYKDTGRAFVSYLSHYSQHHHSPDRFHGYHVEDLVKEIKERHKTGGNIENYAVKYYPPGTLSSEFMTEHRRWQVVSIIDRHIRVSDEFWIFETPEYYNSWWTLAELASLSCVYSEKENNLPSIFLCQPNAEGMLSIKQAEPNFIQRVDSKIAAQFRRRLSNCDPFTMGREQVSKMQKLAKLPVPIQWLAFKATDLYADFSMSGSDIYQEIKKGRKKGLMDFKQYREMLSSPVFTESFWNDRIVDCPKCRNKNTAKHDFNFQQWLLNKQSGQFHISTEKMNEILDSGIWGCPECKFKFRVIKGDHPILIWWPVRMGKPTGPNGIFIERIENYSISSIY